MKSILTAAKTASRSLALLTDKKRNEVLTDVAAAITECKTEILEANAGDLKKMGRGNPLYDRLLLTPERLDAIAADMLNVSRLPSPLGRTLTERTLDNGLRLRRVSVPFGVIGMIYEARPNVTFDVFALCFKSGNACVLKGGSDAEHSNRAAVKLIHGVLSRHGVCPEAVTLLPATHEATAEMLGAVGYIDLCIPRGGRRLIDFVRDTARVPVIETGAGVVNTYFDETGDRDKGERIIHNAKTRRVSVCNALDCLVVDRSRLSVLPALCYSLAEHGVHIYADDEAYEALDGAYPYLHKAAADDFGREWLDYKMSIATVEGIDEAIDFIGRNGSKHSECIVAENREAIERFQRDVDAACVYANVSTAFTDGAQFGFGAEIGISTQKLHARGPMALPEIVTYKYVITGSGQTRP